MATHPTAMVSRGIENIVIKGRDSKCFIVRGGCATLSRLISVTVFPAFLLLELVFKRVPKMVWAIGNGEKFNKKFDKVLKYVIAFPFFPLGLYSPEGVPGFFLKRSPSSAVRPFGVEKQYGINVDHLFCPKNVEELKAIVQQAKTDKKQISIVGAGMSQGTQTVPYNAKQVVINTKFLRDIELSEDKQTVTVQAGATWEQLQIVLNEQGKSTIVKQASDPFSIGGSIGINCHGWAHEAGAISSTVTSLTIIDAKGELKTITPGDELFKCMFGTLGYFGIIVSATLRVVDNEPLIEETEEIELDRFIEYYKTQIKGKDIPLFGGRLVLDNLDGNPLRRVCMVRYTKDSEGVAGERTTNFAQEPKRGTRIERIALKLIAQLPDFAVRRLLSWFWTKEHKHMLEGRRLTRNEALHPPINAFTMLHHSNLHTQWLQEYFIKEENLSAFLKNLGAQLKENDVRLINATIRPTPKDNVSILPYAEQDRFAVVICFAQSKREKDIDKTKKWIEKVNADLLKQGDIFYQAYMPYATREQFEECYGADRVARLRDLKRKYDSDNLFGNAHTRKYFDQIPASPYRHVFQTSEEMKTEFVKFLQTIFYQLDEKKVLAGMETILADPEKTDEQIYTELLDQIGGMKKRFAPLWQIWSLGVLKKGMGQQAAQLLKGFDPKAFNDYMEIYDRRYLDVIRKIAGLPLRGNTIAVCNDEKVNLVDRIEAGALLSSYPYKTHVSMNDEGCTDPFAHPEQTCKPIEGEEKSVDLIACVGGLHHTPKDKLDLFITSMSEKLRPGGVVLLRDHDVQNSALKSIVSLVHTFVNAAGGVSVDVEQKEIRDFRTRKEWIEIMGKHQFTPISPEFLVLKDDPTANGMMAFAKVPQNLEELREAIRYRNDCTRSKDGTRATWIEWGNVRFSKQYAEFVQTHHAYAFDYIGHLRQHWQHFSNYVRECHNDDIGLKNLIFSDNFAMNLFILFSTAVQCTASHAMSLPSMAIARWRNGVNWREISNLTDVEQFEAKVEKEYSAFIDHTPFYMFPYIGKIKELWSVVIHSNSKIANGFSAIFTTLGLLAKAAISAPVRAIYTSEANQEPDTIKVLLKDPKDELDDISEKWEREKDAVHDKNCTIKKVYTTPDGYKLVSLPRYRPFTKICGYMSGTSIELLQVGSQEGISVDVLLNKGAEIPTADDAKLVYKMDKLQDPAGRHYATYQVAVTALQAFIEKIGTDHIEYIHE